MKDQSKRLAKNTAYMYIRMFILMLISIYTSRVILQQLGIIDYGIYNLIGSVIALFSSLRGLFTSSTQRFLNTEMKKGKERLSQIFSIGLTLNFIISIIFVILIEIVGLWFLNYEINIPSDRLTASQYVLQFSILIAVVSIMTTPYDALIIAHEEMGFYTVMSILEGFLKLLIVFLLPYGQTDKLILYVLLLAFVQIVIRFINQLYCRKNFEECKFSLKFDKSLFKEMSKFAGWQFFGNTAYTLTQNGQNMVLNIFGGPVVNAARGIAIQIEGVIGQFINNITFVLNPYCMKLYGYGNFKEFNRTIFMMSKILFLIHSFIIIPIYIFADKILELWLVTVPHYTVSFLRLILLWSLVRCLHSPLDTLFTSYGNIMKYQLIEGFVLSLPVLFSYIFLSAGFSIYSAFIILIIVELINYFIILFLAYYQTNFNIREYFRFVVFPCAVIYITLIVGLEYSRVFIESLYKDFFIMLILLFLVVFFMLLIGFSSHERKFLFSILSTFLKR